MADPKFRESNVLRTLVTSRRDEVVGFFGPAMTPGDRDAFLHAAFAFSATNILSSVPSNSEIAG
jgi:hypothetical protein